MAREDDDLAAAIAASLASMPPAADDPLVPYPSLRAAVERGGASDVQLVRVSRASTATDTPAAGAAAAVADPIQPPEVHMPPLAMSVCIRKTMGTMRSYSDTCLLHVGVSDSTGRVWGFDERGVTAEEWQEAVCYPLQVSAVAPSTTAAFDDALSGFAAAFAASGRRYDALAFNCYDFVCGVLNCVEFKGRADHSKASLEGLLEVPLHAAIGYIRVLARLEAGTPNMLTAVCPPRHAHPLVASTERGRFRCDCCGKEIRGDAAHWRCGSACDFDACGDCVAPGVDPAGVA